MAVLISSPATSTKAGMIIKPPPAPTKPVTTPTPAPSKRISGSWMRTFYPFLFFVLWIESWTLLPLPLIVNNITAVFLVNTNC